jgi:hypothetical protein
MTNVEILVKLTGKLSQAELADFYLLVRDYYVYRIPFPLPGQRPSATPGRFAFATPHAASPPHATRD